MPSIGVAALTLLVVSGVAAQSTWNRCVHSAHELIHHFYQARVQAVVSMVSSSSRVRGCSRAMVFQGVEWRQQWAVRPCWPRATGLVNTGQRQ